MTKQIVTATFDVSNSPKFDAKFASKDTAALHAASAAILTDSTTSPESEYPVPSFDVPFNEYLTALNIFDRASVDFSKSRTAAYQLHVDFCTCAAIPRTKEGFNAVRDSVMSNQKVIDAIANGTDNGKLMEAYALGVARAWFHNVAWHTKLSQNPAYKLPWTKAAPKKSKHGGKDKVASKAVVLKATDIKTAAKEFAALLRKFGMKDFATDFELDVADRLS